MNKKVEERSQDSTSGEPIPLQAKGCVSRVLRVFLYCWIVLLSIINLGGQWLVEQTIFEGSFNIPDVRWKITLGFALLLLVPSLLTFLLSSSTSQKAVYLVLSLAAGFVLFQTPVKLLEVTATQGAMAVQIGIMGLFVGALWIIKKRDPNSGGHQTLLPTLREPAGRLGLLAGLILLAPWAAFGALGSPLDTFLALGAGWMLGLSLNLIISTGQGYLVARNTRNEPRRDLKSNRWLIFLILLILTTALAQNGNEWILAILVPATTFGLVMIGQLTGREKPDQAWQSAILYPSLATAWPLMWLDADELNLVTGSGSGESLQWAGIALLLSMALIFLTGLSLVFAVKRGYGEGFPSMRIFWTFLSIEMVLAVVLFLEWGRPGFFGERLFVILKNQADTSEAATITDPIKKRERIYRTLVDQAETDQADLRQVFDRWGIDYTPFYLVNAIEVKGGPLVRLWLINRPEVDRVLTNPVLRPLPEPVPVSRGDLETTPAGVDWNLTMIHADQVWALGITGKGVVIGQSDSGVQGNHPELADSYRGEAGIQDYNWYDPWNHSLSPVDIGGHGTHTLGTILGNQTGVAPDATWIGCVNLARNLGNPSFYLECWQFMLAPFPQNGEAFTDGKPDLGANILNNSWGCPAIEGCDSGVFLPAASALKNAGIFVVASAGNSGYSGCGSVEDPPAIYNPVYSVGAVTQTGSLASFSSLGPVTVDGSLRTKPDILAPGQDVFSSFPESSYEIASGTSMAGPHVAGVVALIWSGNPSLIGKVDETIAILNQSAQPFEGIYPPCIKNPGEVPNNAVGYGIVDAFAAVRLALSTRLD